MARFEPRSGRSIETINPATESSLSRISEADATDVNLAVVAARKALKNWRRAPALERAKYLYRIARRIQERARELAVLETMDNGKPIRESRDEDIPQAAAHFFITLDGAINCGGRVLLPTEVRRSQSEFVDRSFRGIFL